MSNMNIDFGGPDGELSEDEINYSLDDISPEEAQAQEDYADWVSRTLSAAQWLCNARGSIANATKSEPVPEMFLRQLRYIWLSLRDIERML